LLFNADASEWLQDASLPVKIFHVTFQRKGSGMNNIETQLLESGFTVKELAYLNRNISRYGSSLLEVVLELGKRFIMVLFLTAVVALIFLALLFSLSITILFPGHFSFHRVGDCLVFSTPGHYLQSLALQKEIH
jgi:hypothetical protein